MKEKKTTLINSIPDLQLNTYLTSFAPTTSHLLDSIQKFLHIRG